MVEIEHPAELTAWEGKELGYSQWVHVSQEMINDFAKATGDFQWIHVDKERAVKESPFGTTIAHGFLTLSLVPRLMDDIWLVKNADMAVNFGVNKVRFTNHVPSGAKIRMHSKAIKILKRSSSIHAIVECTFEREDSEKPVCTAETITIFYFKPEGASNPVVK